MPASSAGPHALAPTAMHAASAAMIDAGKATTGVSLVLAGTNAAAADVRSSWSLIWQHSWATRHPHRICGRGGRAGALSGNRRALRNLPDDDVERGCTAGDS